MEEEPNRNSTLSNWRSVTQLVEQDNDATLKELVTQQSVKNRSLGQPSHHGAGGTEAEADPKKN